MHHRSLFLALFFAPLLAMACPWQGTYTGTLQGVPVALTLHCEDAVYVGHMEAEGYPYTLHLTPGDANTATGTFADPALGGTRSCSAQWTSGTLTLRIGELEALLAGGEPLELVFRRTATEAVRTPAPASPAPATGTRDGRLVGTWVYSESYVSGDFSFATEWRLTLGADGSLRQVGRTVGGGPDVSGDSGEGEVATGRWRTSNGRIEVDAGTGFKPHAQYSCDGARVMFTLTNGDKQVWVRD
jgi:hypothetical protein